MSLENRSSSAMFKRAEQLKRWEESATNQEDIELKKSCRKIQFSSGCVFLAACASGDKEEVLRLLEEDADIDTANVDGLTALHQACIDDNLEMVEFLVAHGADVNRGDNEGWTPLHATASCGFVSIAKFLIEHGANIAAVNNDGELPLDIAESDSMDQLLQEMIDAKGIDCDEARNKEENMMLKDAEDWLNGKTSELGDPFQPHPKTGATALHVAAAKGYIKVMSVLLEGNCDVDAQDYDGWTPLHASAHWGQKEAAELLVEHFCDMDIKNCVGQTALDVADADMVKNLEDLKTKQAALQKDRPPPNNLLNKIQNSPKRRMSNSDKINLISKDATSERQILDRTISEEEPPTNTLKEVQLEIDGESEKEDATTDDSQLDKKNRANTMDIDKTQTVPTVTPSTKIEEESTPQWRRPGSFRNQTQPPSKNLHLNIEKNDVTAKNQNASSDVVLRRTHSFEADEKFYRKYLELQARIASSCPTLHPPTGPGSGVPAPLRLPARSASLREQRAARRARTEDSRNSTEISTPTTPSTTTISTTVSTTTSTSLTTVSQPTIRRSFVPPVRDEESETQRKAHAKRARETRRSTQGVTLEEIKSAEQLVKKKNQQINNNNNNNNNTNNNNNSNEQFLLEDARNKTTSPTSPTEPPSRRQQAIATPVEVMNDTSVILPLRKVSRVDDKEDKENDSRNALATQAVIQRRRKPKRRSTGVVHVDMDEIDPDKHDTGGAGESNSLHNDESGNDLTGRSSSRLSSVSSTTGGVDDNKTTENGELDYKKLYEESLVVNERLRDKLKKTEDELDQVKNQVNSNKGVSLSELDKRERRAMERKLSEMEEELKQLQKLKAENERLKAENRALTRVVSKLTNSASK